jgi:polyhydroxybutyrate depolymerase
MKGFYAQITRNSGGSNLRVLFSARDNAMNHCAISMLTFVFALLAAGCARIAPAAPTPQTPNPPWKPGDYTQSLSFAGRERTYLVHSPPAAGTAPRPLVIILHGGGGTGAGMQSLTRGGMNALADKEGFVVVYPDGVEKQWNDGRQIAQARAMRENIDDVGFLAALIDRLAEATDIDRRRVYATGISNGGMMSQRLACELSDQIAAIGVIASSMSENLFATCQPAQPVSVLLIPGTDDPLVPYQGGEIRLGNIKRGKSVSISETVAFWTRHNNCPVSPVTARQPDADPQDGTRVRKETYAPCRTGSAVILYAIEGGGHTWPNGLQYLPEQVVGRTSRDLDANTILWEFFKQHPK